MNTIANYILLKTKKNLFVKFIFYFVLFIILALILLQIASLFVTIYIYYNLRTNNCDDCNIIYSNYIYYGAMIILCLLLFNIIHTILEIYCYVEKNIKIRLLKLFFLVNIFTYNIFLTISIIKLNASCNCIKKIYNEYLFLKKF